MGLEQPTLMTFYATLFPSHALDWLNSTPANGHETDTVVLAGLPQGCEG